MPHPSPTRRGLLGLAVASAAIGTATLVGAASAAADEYPSWSDVLAARRNVKRQAKEVARIKGLLERSRAAAARAEQVAEQRGTAYQAARGKVDAAAARIAVVQKQVDADAARAKAATQRAGQLAAQLARGGADPETTLLLSGADDGSAEGFLARLGRLSKLTESNAAIAAEAKAAKNSAAATQAQLAEAKTQLVELQKAAQAAYNQAITASRVANEQVQREQAAQVELQAQLDELQAKSDSTAQAYRRGVAARQAAQVAGSAGAVAASGWATPAYGPITAGFGPRPDQPAGANYFHRGTDLGAGYGAAIYAAHAGTVVYAGWYGTYGNFVEVQHDDGFSTGYAHIRPGGTFVNVGDRVAAGQNIASVGQTGAATGPHLHFETRIAEVAVNAVPFMAERGIALG